MTVRFSVLAALGLAMSVAGCGGGSEDTREDLQLAETLSATEEDKVVSTRDPSAVVGAVPRNPSTKATFDAVRQQAVASIGQGTGVEGGTGDSQRLFEEIAVRPATGYYRFSFGISADLPSPWTVPASSRTVLPASPSLSGAFVQAEYSPLQTKVPGITLSDNEGDTHPLRGSYTILDGRMVFAPAVTAPQFAYEGESILWRVMGQGSPVFVHRITSIEKVPLVGTLADAPVDFKEFYIYRRQILWNLQHRFQEGAAYYRFKSTTLEDRFFPVLQRTDIQAVAVPAPDTSMKRLADADPSLYDQKTINGTPCLVTKFRTTDPNDGRFYSLEALCEAAGAVYRGAYSPKGSQAAYPGFSSTGAAKYLTHRIYFNRQAIDSLEAAFIPVR